MLHYLEGKSHEQSAEELNWPVGTVRSRLARGRELLRQRLARRGVQAGALWIGTTTKASAGAVPVELTRATIELAGGASVASPAFLLAERVIRDMTRHKYITTGAATLSLILLVGGVGAYFAQVKTDDSRAVAAPAVKAWGEEANGLRLRVASDRLSYCKGKDLVDVLFVVHNMGSKPAEIKLGKNDLEAYDLVVQALDESGRPKDSDIVVRGLNLEWDTSRPVDRTVAPDNIDSFRKVFDPDKYLLTPGRYRLRGQLHDPKLDSNWFEFKLTDEDVQDRSHGEIVNSTSLSLSANHRTWKPGNSALEFSVLLEGNEAFPQRAFLEITDSKGRTVQVKNPWVNSHRLYDLFRNKTISIAGKRLGERFVWDPQGVAVDLTRFDNRYAVGMGSPAVIPGTYKVVAVYRLNDKITLRSNPVEILLEGPLHGEHNLDQSWTDLAKDDPIVSHAALIRFRAEPKAAEFLGAKLRPPEKMDAKIVDRLLDQLDNDNFEVRDKASEDLQRLGESALPTLSNYLARQGLSLEMRRRLKQLVDHQEHPPWDADARRFVRAIAVLESIADADARRAINTRAEGDPNAWRSVQAKKALQRLDRKEKP